MLDVFECSGAIADFLSNAGTQTSKNAKTFLRKELRMFRGAKEILSNDPFGPMQRATILAIGYPSDGHFSFSIHGKFRLEIYLVFFEGVRSVLSIPWAP